MKKNISVITIISIFLFCSCSSLRNSGSSSFSDSNSPYIKEEPSVKEEEKAVYAEKIVVKEEKVTVIDRSDKDKDYKFYVVIGSFKILENARNYKSQILNEGFKAIILENENGLYRVSVKATNEESLAREEIDTIRTNFEKHKDTWLLIRKY